MFLKSVSKPLRIQLFSGYDKEFYIEFFQLNITLNKRPMGHLKIPPQFKSINTYIIVLIKRGKTHYLLYKKWNGSSFEQT